MPLLLIVTIGWMYVVILMAATQPDWLSAVLTLFGYGLFPLGIVLYLLDAPRRGRRRRERERAG
ncbi:MAG: hypothetical protein R3E68_17860 [Burkholderiaceae bacterium]